MIKQRQDKIILFLKEKSSWITYVLLAIIVFIAVKIRTRNLDGLKDITTDTWTLGPDLDPFLFLRWAKYIVENGNLFALDVMRYVPLGYDTGRELLLHPYMMAWFHNILSFLGVSESITFSAIIYPVFFFAMTIVAFFLFVRKIFVGSLGVNKSNVIALISSFLLALSPVLLPRTIAGIPEKESAAFFFMFMAFYLFLSAWNSKKKYSSYIFAVFAGIFTAGMAFVWGGYGYIFLTIGFASLAAFFFDQVKLEQFLVLGTWLLSSFIIMVPSERYDLAGLLVSATISPSVFVFLASGFLLLIKKDKIRSKLKLERLSKIPLQIVSAVFVGVAGIFFSLAIFGMGSLKSLVDTVIFNLTKPAQSRLIQTVAENRQPYFGEWAGSFGPIINGFPLFFWIFFIASVFLVYNLFKSFKKKEKIILTLSYLLSIISIVFSRYSINHVLNGESLLSSLFYVAGPLVLTIFGIRYYLKDHKQTGLENFRNISYGLIFLILLFVLGLVSARAAVRLIIILAIPGSILAGYFIITLFEKAKSSDKNIFYWIIFAVVLLCVIYSTLQFYEASIASANSYTPSPYHQQWQKAMSWVRENTPKNAVFAHWWDYGYWIQSIGERATVLDGGNAQSYWNHLMGRHALTSSSSRDAAEFLYAHNVTHFLIDSTDIGKYGAYSFIGSNASLDRRSSIQTFLKDNSQIQQTKNSTIALYKGGFGLDDDVLYESNGEKIFLPAEVSGLGGVLIEKDTNGEIISQPIGIFVYQGRQYNIPIKQVFFKGKLVEFNSGMDAGIFIFPAVDQNSGGISIEIDGALLFLSGRTFESQIARLYLFGEENEYFQLAHKEDDFFVAQLKTAYPALNSDFVHAGGFRGPIKIWEVKYPGIEFREEYIQTEYPRELQFS